MGLHDGVIHAMKEIKSGRKLEGDLLGGGRGEQGSLLGIATLENPEGSKDPAMQSRGGHGREHPEGATARSGEKG